MKVRRGDHRSFSGTRTSGWAVNRQADGRFAWRAFVDDVSREGTATWQYQAEMAAIQALADIHALRAKR